MKLRINSLRLVGTERTVIFRPGLNIIVGPISTGKTTLLELCRAFLGGSLSGFPPEVKRAVAALGAELTLGSRGYSVLRPFVTTETADVEVAGEGLALRLPALRPTAASERTYRDWLLEALDLPRLRVPSAPARPDSESTPVTINDYLLYSHLSQTEIDSSIFGSTDPFRNIKRKYVFEIVYGKYNVEMTELQERLREVMSSLRTLRSGISAFHDVLSDTAWENRAQIEDELQETRARLAESESEMASAAQRANAESQSDELVAARSRTAALLELRKASRDKDRSSVERLGRLRNQLVAQSGRLTKSIVADTLLSDFDFVVCPRCGAAVSQNPEAAANLCYLCSQEPQPSASKVDLMREQERIEDQIAETDELISQHRMRIDQEGKDLAELENRLQQLDGELDLRNRAYVSREAQELELRSAYRASLLETVRRLEDYRGLFTKIDQQRLKVAELEEQRTLLESRLDVAASAASDFGPRLSRLEFWLGEILAQFCVPRLADPPTAIIDKRTYLPVVDGRSFESLFSQGLMTLVNVAHALAHQRNAVELGLALPGILFVDGVGNFLGHDELDENRLSCVYDSLRRTSEEIGDELQIIMAENSVPPQLEEFVRLRLSEEDRLIPPS